MSLSVWSAGDATLVRLTISDEVSHSSRQLLVPINQPAYIRSDQRAVNATHIHLTVLMDRHRAWQGTKDLTRACVSENFTRRPVLEHPRVELGSLLVRHIHVVLDSVQV